MNILLNLIRFSKELSRQKLSSKFIIISIDYCIVRNKCKTTPSLPLIGEESNESIFKEIQKF